jgi:hypothetical protein
MFTVAEWKLIARAVAECRARLSEGSVVHEDTAAADRESLMADDILVRIRMYGLAEQPPQRGRSEHLYRQARPGDICFLCNNPCEGEVYTMFHDELPLCERCEKGKGA